MTLLGLTLEDLVAIITIGGAFVSVLIWGFKRAFHTVYEKENADQRKRTEKLLERVDDFYHVVDMLNETMKELQADLKQNNATLNNHEVRITVLEKSDRNDKD